MTILEATPNPFRGIVLNPDALPSDPELFRRRLALSLKTWDDEGYRVVWFEVPIEKAALIPVAAEAGFGFHHSSDTYLMMTLRLDPEALIPNYATHFIGAGGVVLNNNDELLVVSEQYRRNRDHPYYKLPGGALHPGEHLAAAVVREVFEETGVQAKFEKLVCFRHWHGYRYGKSDIYFVCRLSAISQEINKQDDEIEECIWMPVQEYLSNEYVGAFNKRIVAAAMNGAGVELASVDGYGNPTTHEFFMPPGL